MKKTFLMAALLFCAGGGFISSCSDDDETKDGPVTSKSPIESVTAVDGSKTATATISDDAKTIDFGTFENLIDLSAVQVTFKLAKGVVMKSPSKAETTVSLMQPLKVVVNNGKEDITYTMTGKAMEIPEPVKSVKVNGKDVPVTITEAGREIVIAYTDGMDVSALKLELSLENGATVKSPEGDTTFDLEFTPSGSLVVNFYDTDYTYTVKLSGYSNVFAKNGWTDVSSDYGTLPSYLKVFKTTKMGNTDGEDGYIVLLSKGAKIGVLGTGTADKNIAAYVAEKTYTVYMATSSTTGVSLFSDGKSVFPRDHTQLMLAQDADGNFSMENGQLFDGKYYSFPFRTTGTSYVARDVKDGKEWKFQDAIGTLNALVYDGVLVTSDQAMANNNYSAYMENTTKYSRAAVGILKSGKVILVNTQGPVTGVSTCLGQSHFAVAADLIALGCQRAGVYEGSGSPSLVVNGKHTAINKNDPKGDCTGTGLKKQVGILAVK